MDEPDRYEVVLDCPTVSVYRQALVMQRCLQLFAERNEIHQDAWQPGGLRANLVKLRLKVERAWRQHWCTGLRPTEELLDAINYAVFCVRCADDDDVTGGWEW